MNLGTELRVLERMFLDAAIQPERWPAALDAMADATRSQRGELIGISRGCDVPFNYITGFPEDALELFKTIGGASADINYRIAASAQTRPGVIVGEDSYDRVRGEIDCGIYDDFCSDYDIPHGVQVSLIDEPGRLVGLAVLRGEREGRTSAEEREVFAKIAPMARNAVEVQNVLAGQGAQLLAGALDSLSIAALLIDGYGYVRAITPAAERLQASDARLCIRQGVVEPTDPGHRAVWNKALGIALSGQGDLMRRRSLVLGPCDPSMVPLRVDLVTLPVEPWSLHFRPRVIMVLKLSDTPPLDVALIQSAFGLTRAEAEVAAMMVGDHSRSEIAATRGVSFSTVDSQLRTIYQKLGVSREATLIRRIRDLF